MVDLAQTQEEETKAAPGATNSVTDPVCGMAVDPHSAKHRHAVDGRTYYLLGGMPREIRRRSRQISGRKTCRGGVAARP